MHLFNSPLAVVLLLVAALLCLTLLSPAVRKGTVDALLAVCEAIIGKPRTVAYAGRRFGVKTAVSTQGTKLEIETATPDTFIEIIGVTDVVDPTGEASDLDSTNLKSTRKEYIPGLEDSPAVTINGQKDAADPGQQALAAAVGTTKKFRQTLSDGEIMAFDAVVKKYGPSGSVDGVLMFAASIRPTGDITYTGTGHTT